MTIVNAFLIAFATYSRIPMPNANWEEKNMKYPLCFFPIVGSVIGLIVVAWFYLANLLSFNNILIGAVGSCIPMFVTGGIHLDGFCDTIDAISSYQTRERRLEILKDSNAGAFAIIKCCAFYILYFAIFTQLNITQVYIVALGFALSRALSGLAIANFKSARENGMVASFKKATHRKTVTIVLVVMAILVSLSMVLINLIYGLVAIATALIIFLYYKKMSYKTFGGTTGDIAGYFLELCEIYIAFSIVIAEGVLKLCV